jgi:protein ATS1
MPQRSRLYAFGSNASGQLGIGHRQDVDIPTRCHFDSAVDQIAQIAAGGNHTLVLTESGQVFASGSNGSGRSGLPPNEKGDENNETTFRLVRYFTPEEGSVRRVTHVAATWEASFFVVDDRKVYACGRGERGELGKGHGVIEMSPPYPPQCIFDVEQIGPTLTVLSIQGGMAHVVILLSDNRLFGWGSNRRGQLGGDSKSETSVSVPRSIDIDGQVHSVAVGRSFTIVETLDRRVSLLGNDVRPLGATKEWTLTPTETLWSSWSGGYVYDAINCNVRMLRLKDRVQTPLPAVRDRLFRFSVGSEHCLAIGERQGLIAWGWGEHGNTGPSLKGPNSSRIQYNVISLGRELQESVYLIACGCATSFAAIRET